MTAPSTVTGSTPTRPAASRSGAGRRIVTALPVLPFFLYVGVFLLLPTALVVIGAFRSADGGFTLGNLALLKTPAVVKAMTWSLGLSAITAVVGAVIGGLLAYALSTANPAGLLRRLVVAACSVLAQFGGVMLAFAFIALIGRFGSVTVFLREVFGVNFDTTWLYDFNGLVLVYTYFQIPLMVIVFLPALDGIKPQWREATESLGGSTGIYWLRVAGPILMPAFISSALLLFANAFSAYATAAALISQENPLLATQIRGFLGGEVVLDTANSANVLALLMVVIVALVMWAYAWGQKRASRWLG